MQIITGSLGTGLYHTALLCISIHFTDCSELPCTTLHSHSILKVGICVLCLMKHEASSQCHDGHHCCCHLQTSQTYTTLILLAAGVIFREQNMPRFFSSLKNFTETAALAVYG